MDGRCHFYVVNLQNWYIILPKIMLTCTKIKKSQSQSTQEEKHNKNQKNSCSITHKLIESRISAKSKVCYCFHLCMTSTVQVLIATMAITTESCTAASMRPFPKHAVTSISLFNLHKNHEVGVLSRI